MTEIAVDTQAFVLRMENRRASQKVKMTFEEAEAGKIGLVVPAMVFAEIGYLSQKHRIKITLAEALAYLTRHSSVREQPLQGEAVQVAFEIDDIAELHDRLIAATAKWLNVSLLANDAVIQASKHLTTIW